MSKARMGREKSGFGRTWGTVERPRSISLGRGKQRRVMEASGKSGKSSVGRAGAGVELEGRHGGGPRGGLGALQVVLEPLQRATGVVEARGALAVAVALARVEHQAHRARPALSQVPVELARLPGVHARVVLAVQDQERSLALGRVVDGAALEPRLPVVPGVPQGV